MQGLIDQKNALKFITGGNATLTFKSLVTGNHFTYRCMTSDDNKYLIIGVLNGKDNSKNYLNIAIFFLTNDFRPILQVMNSKTSENSPSFKAFKFVFMNLLLKSEKEIINLEIYHEGKCCRCGRKLTVPESITTGIGPECVKKQNSFNI